jgi:hypothetical protein
LLTKVGKYTFYGCCQCSQTAISLWLEPLIFSLAPQLFNLVEVRAIFGQKENELDILFEAGHLIPVKVDRAD